MRHRFQTANLDPRDYPGAGILLPGSTASRPIRPFFPPTHLVGLDMPKVYANECSLPYGAGTIRSCPSGTPDSPVTVAVVVRRDRHHITARYAETLAPLLPERLAPSVTAGHARNE